MYTIIFTSNITGMDYTDWSATDENLEEVWEEAKDWAYENMMTATLWNNETDEIIDSFA